MNEEIVNLLLMRVEIFWCEVVWFFWTGLIACLFSPAKSLMWGCFQKPDVVHLIKYFWTMQMIQPLRFRPADCSPMQTIAVTSRNHLPRQGIDSAGFLSRQHWPYPIHQELLQQSKGGLIVLPSSFSLKWMNYFPLCFEWCAGYKWVRHDWWA